MSQLNQRSVTTDKDYLKIAYDGTLLLSTVAASDPDFAFPADPFGNDSQQGVATIKHNLGSVPIVRAFLDPGANGLWYSSQASIGLITIDPILLTIVDSTNIKLCIASGSAKSSIPVFYRIYKTTSEGISSDDRIDKIFSKSPAGYYIDCGAASSSSNPVQATATIPHNKNKPVIWSMQFSADGQSWYNDGNFIYGPPDTSSGPAGGPYSNYYYMRAYASGDDNNFYLRVENNYATAKRFYVRWVLDYRE